MTEEFQAGTESASNNDSNGDERLATDVQAEGLVVGENEAELLRAALRCDSVSCACQRGGHVHCPAHDDESPAFSIHEGDERSVVFHCFVGCEPSDVLQALTERKLWPPRPAEPAPPTRLTLRQYAEAKQLDIAELRSYGLEDDTPWGRSAVRMPYLNEDGETEAVRYRVALHGKDKFFWEKGAKPTLYGRLRLSDARAAGYVVLVEGESDCHTLWHYDIPAIGIPGASMWKEEKFAGLFDGIEDIFLFIEPDGGGEKLLKSLSESVLADRIRIIRPRGFDDPSDLHLQDPEQFKDRWARAMDNAELLSLVADEVSGDYETAQEAPRQAESGAAVQVADAMSPDGVIPPASLPDQTPTDIDVARSFAATHSGQAFYVHQMKGAWFIWDGARYKRDDTQQIVKVAMEDAVSSAAQATSEMHWRDADTYRKRAQSGGRLRETVKLAGPLMAAEPSQLDADDWLLNVANGTVDLRTGELRPHNPDDRLTKVTWARYEKDARSDDWEDFIERVVPDPELRGYLQKFMGYTLVGDPREDVIGFIIGPTRTGKSTFLEAVKHALGDYAMTADIDALAAGRRTGQVRNDLARLKGSRLVTGSETERDQTLAASVIKSLSGGDTLAVRFLYEESTEGRPQFTILMATNEPPRLPDDDDAISERVRVIPFEQHIAEDERDKEMRQKLREPKAAEAILAWMIRGCLAWQEEGLSPPDSVRAASAALRRENDPIANWFDECCVEEVGARTQSSLLWDSYRDFCGSRPLISQAQFSQRLVKRGFERIKSGGRQYYRDIKLL